ncbi:hypothetical protein [Aggregatilinea lenta]|uniref:hypothetical protein n=1 Tax=Aggregatilinea lenta TaxID=913108 RepID=UPI000E5AC176|nr:hypothetical protein [Aggregatilinea lenta]
MKRLVMTVCMLVWLGVQPLCLPRMDAQAQDNELVAEITSPVEGQQLFGMVSIAGRARHPGAFASYTLEYDDLSDPAEQWIPVQERVSQQVAGGVLGVWNTNAVPDGTYQLRLRVTLTTGDAGEYSVRGLRVINSAPTPVPTLPGSVQNSTPQASTPGPSPTSPVQQPPSNNPGSSAGPEAAIGQPDDSSAPVADEEPAVKTTVNLDRVQDAFCAGATITGALAVLVAAYVVIRRRVRPRTQEAPWPHRNPPHHPT